MADCDRFVRAAAAAIGAAVEPVQSHPDFRRYLVRDADETMVVDVALDSAPQVRPKVDRGGVQTDSAEEIVANKICALVGRSEVRDLVDLYWVEDWSLSEGVSPEGLREFLRDLEVRIRRLAVPGPPAD
jgi:hypothetical protein